MLEMEFKYELANIDMKGFYREIFGLDIDCPEVILVKENEDGSDILRREMVNGNHLIYLKDSDNKVDILKRELENNAAKVVPAFSFENHNYSNKDVKKCVECACKLADVLGVKCPQIVFTAFEDAGNSSEDGILYLPNKKIDEELNVIEMFICIAHELRHEWQHMNHPDWFEGYVHVEREEDLEAYLNHRTEIDAEAYARELANIVFDVSLLRKRDENTKKLKARANELCLCLHKDIVNYLRDLFDV